MPTLRPFQKTALDALENPNALVHHVICVAPTGAGKSLIYEKAAHLPGRRTLLVTPLVALARQQYTKLQATGIPVRLGAGGNLQKPPPTQTGTWIISPEMLHSSSNQILLNHWKPNFLVVDECHCLWEWGENFRPAFGLIPPLLKNLNITRSLWLTATLPYDAKLQLRKLLPTPLVELGEFDLPSKLHLSVQRVSWEYRTQALLDRLRKMRGPGIIFVPTRETTLRMSRLTQALGKNTLTYHGGMSSDERKNAEILISKKIPEVIIATSAFGMGMDYSHLKYVILWQAPTSILSLVQTIGRVGRSHEQSHAVLFWDYDDFRLLEWTLAGSEKRKKEFLDLIHFLESTMCRRSSLKSYFDPTYINHGPSHCNLCDSCISQ